MYIFVTYLGTTSAAISWFLDPCVLPVGDSAIKSPDLINILYPERYTNSFNVSSELTLLHRG